MALDLNAIAMELPFVYYALTFLEYLAWELIVDRL